MLKPLGLTSGDLIKIISPSSSISNIDSLYKGKQQLESMGYIVDLGESCFLRNESFIDTDELRAKDINDAFLSNQVKMIMAARGGYGSVRILDLIDYDKIKRNPKIFIGYSDITALNNAIYRKTSLVTFHGPMLSTDFLENIAFTIEHFIKAITGSIKDLEIELIPIREGDVEGKIIGGNLSVICSLLYSNYDSLWKDKIIFIEDIGEEPYKIDRMLQMLKLSGVFKRVTAVILGEFTNCLPLSYNEPALDNVIDFFFSQLDLPIYKGLMTGHSSKIITIPIGIKVKISNNILRFIEEGVIL